MRRLIRSKNIKTFSILIILIISLFSFNLYQTKKISKLSEQVQSLENSLVALNRLTENRFKIIEKQKENNKEIIKIIERGNIEEIQTDYNKMISEFKEISTW